MQLMDLAEGKWCICCSARNNCWIIDERSTRNNKLELEHSNFSPQTNANEPHEQLVSPRGAGSCAIRGSPVQAKQSDRSIVSQVDLCLFAGESEWCATNELLRQLDLRLRDSRRLVGGRQHNGNSLAAQTGSRVCFPQKNVVSSPNCQVSIKTWIIVARLLSTEAPNPKARTIYFDLFLSPRHK